MDWILNLIPGGSLTLIIGAIMAVLGALGIVSRKATIAERNRNKAKEAEAREKNIRDMADAAVAKPTGSVHDDPNNRDNRTQAPMSNFMDTGGVQRQKRQPGNRKRKSGTKRKA